MARRGQETAQTDVEVAQLARADLRGPDLTGVDLLAASVRGAVLDAPRDVSVARLLGFDVR